jgi:crotonobetainyl-CoA:carnitine CoA-transferase CaiB-like acyl-CoA transferase
MQQCRNPSRRCRILGYRVSIGWRLSSDDDGRDALSDSIARVIKVHLEFLIRPCVTPGDRSAGAVGRPLGKDVTMTATPEHYRVPDTAASMVDGPTGPLVGMRIIDVTHAASGPLTSMLLADMGADVIKVEPPGGDLVRKVGPFHPEDDVKEISSRFAYRHRNKRSIVLDLTTDRDRATFLELVDSADALLENMRAGVMDRLGVGFETCHARNSKLVYGAIRGFGDPRTGESPYSDWPAYDVVAQAMGGLVAVTGPDKDHPMRAGAIIGDFVPSFQLLSGLLAALLHAERTGQGQFVDVAMVDGVMSLNEASIISWVYEGHDYEPMGNKTDGIVPFGVFKTIDGWCAIAGPLQHQWELIAKVMGREDLLDDERLATLASRAVNRELVDEPVTAWALSQTNAQVLEALGGKVPVAPVHGASDWMTDPGVAAREMIIGVDHPHAPTVPQLGCPIKFASTPTGVYRSAPMLDEHGDEIRAELEKLKAGG